MMKWLTPACTKNALSSVRERFIAAIFISSRTRSEEMKPFAAVTRRPRAAQSPRTGPRLPLLDQRAPRHRRRLVDAEQLEHGGRDVGQDAPVRAQREPLATLVVSD